MKRLPLLFLLTLVLAVGLHAQPIDREMFAKVVGMNSKRNCPMWVDGVTVEKLTYSPGVLHFHITVQEEGLMGLGIPELKQLCANRLRYRLEQTYFNYLYSHLGDINGGIAYDVKIKETDSAFTIRYSPQEMRQIWADRSKPAYKDSKQWKARLALQKEVHQSNRHADDNPVTPEQAILRDSLSIANETLTFHFHSINDAILDNLKEQQEAVTEELRYYFISDAALLEEVVETGYAVRFLYVNYSRTDSFFIRFTPEELEQLIAIAEKLRPANKSQMDAYMKEAAQVILENFEPFDSTDHHELVSADFMEGTLLFVFSTPENSMNFNMTPNEQEIVKNMFVSAMKTSIEEAFETPEIWDTIVITKEMFLDHLKGVRVLYMEENTHRTNEISITTEEIINGKMMATSMDSLTREKVIEQMMPELYANEVEKFSREHFPEKTGSVTIERMRYDGESLHLHCTIDSISISKLDTSALKTILQNQIASTRGNENFYDPLISLNGGVMFHYRILETDSTLEIYFSPAEVMEIMSMENYSEERQAQAELDNLVISTNLQCPYQLDGSMRLDSTGIDNGRFFYCYTITAYAPNVSPNIMHDWMRTQLAESEDESVKYLIQLCVKTGTALSYRYFLPKQEEPSRKKKKAEKPQKPALEIWFTVDELKEMLH